MSTDRTGARKARGDLAFALFHVLLLLSVLAYGVLSFFRGNILRFLLILVLLAGYYVLVLHGAVKKEIKRKKTERGSHGNP